MNIIFLDIDGVMRTEKSDKQWSEITGQPVPVNVFERLFSNHSVSTLNEIIYLTDAKIVVSSTWRKYHTLQELEKAFRIRGVRGEIIDTTKILENRGEEIQEWLDTHQVNKYVVIDDNIKNIILHINPNKVIECCPKTGLTIDLFDKITDLLL